MKKEINYLIFFTGLIFIFSSFCAADPYTVRVDEDITSLNVILNPKIVTYNKGLTLNKLINSDFSKIKILVNGMVCSFCAQGLKKSFKNNDAVKSVLVSLEDKSVILELNNTISDTTIKKIINDAGYNLEEIIRL